MTQEEFHSIKWRYGNKVKLTNGKEYKVLMYRKNGLVLFSEEYHATFFMTHDRIVERTSDKRKRRRITMKTYEKV